MCKSCFRISCLVDNAQKCKGCELMCNNEQCLKIHSERWCEKLKPCQACGYIKAAYNHVCGDEQKWCPNCKKSVQFDNKCFILTEEEKNNKKSSRKTDFKGYFFFDFETFENSETHKHVVNLAMAQKICLNCLDIVNPDKRCENCNKINIFYNIDDFCAWSLAQKNTIQIAHNLKGYDGKFILNYMLKNVLPTDALPKAIPNGTKHLTIRFRGIKFIDSLSFLPMPLSSFCIAFSLKENAYTKGYFPHSFNSPEN